MWYNPENRVDVLKAVEKIKYLVKHNKVFEIKEKRKRRSISQNNYLHLILSWFALETGYTMEEVKQEIFKKVVNPGTFYEGEFGRLVKIERWRSTANLNTAEMTLCIDRFRHYSAKEAGIYLPEPEDMVKIREMEKEIENNKKFI